MKACQAGFRPLHTHTGFPLSLYVRRQLNNISKVWRMAVTKNLYPRKLCQQRWGYQEKTTAKDPESILLL